MHHKIVQWATGSMGKTCLRAIIENPALELVGLYVYSDQKAGLDAGDIARQDKTGVIATKNIDEILALEADVVIHMPQLQAPYSSHNDDICRLLASGKNVISINGHSYPQHWGGEYMQAFNDACMQGQSTLFGGGLNPGFITEKIATVATGICSRIDHIEVEEVIPCNVMQNPNYVFDMLGFGSEYNELDPNDPDWAPAEILNGMYAEVVAHLVKRLGFSLDRVETDHVMFPATKDITMSAGLIKKGTVSHTNWRWHGIVAGKPLVTMSIHWVMESAHLPIPDYPVWTIRIDGMPGVDIAIDLRVPEGHPYKTTAEQYAVAASVINSIPSVVAAPPGIREIPFEDLYRAS